MSYPICYREGKCPTDIYVSWAIGCKPLSLLLCDISRGPLHKLHFMMEGTTKAVTQDQMEGGCGFTAESPGHTNARQTLGSFISSLCSTLDGQHLYDKSANSITYIAVLEVFRAKNDDIFPICIRNIIFVLTA